MNTDHLPRGDGGAHPGAPDALSTGLHGLRADVAPERDLWPGIAARLEPRAGGMPPGNPADARAGRPARRQRGHQRRNAGYAVAAALVLAAGIGWQTWPGVAPDLPLGPPQVAAIQATPEANAPLLHAADALAREYQGALREVAAASDVAMQATPTAAIDGLDAELERRATEVRAALARDPDAVHLLHRLQDIYAHRLALSLRRA